MNKRKILVIDDEVFIRELVKDFLELKDIQCDDAEDAERALSKYSQSDYDLVLLDVNLGKSKVEDVIAQLRSIRDGIPIVLLTGDPQYGNGYAERIGADGVIFKPFQVDNFIKNIETILEN